MARPPLVLAILAAALAAAGNALVSVENGVQQRRLENQRSEETRILEMIRTGDTEKAAANLKFLLDAGLIDDPERLRKIKDFLRIRQPGTGPALPSGPIVPAIAGAMDHAVAVDSLPPTSGVRSASRAVGRLEIVTEEGFVESCTAFLVSGDLALTAGHCTKGARSAVLQMSDSDSSSRYDVQLPPVMESLAPLNFSLLRITGEPGKRYGTLALGGDSPQLGEELAMVYFRGDPKKLAVVSSCQVVRKEQKLFYHLCDTGAGTSGAPILTRDGQHVLGLHYSRSVYGGEADRSDVILTAIKGIGPF